MLNKVQLIGNLGADPETRHTQSGQAVGGMRVATTETWTGKDGTKEQKTEWHRVVTWGKLAEICDEYLSKGRQVYVEGKLQTREWEDKDGVTRYTTEIVAQVVRFLGGPGSDEKGDKGGKRGPSGSRSGKGRRSGGGGYKSPSQPKAQEDDFYEDDVPF